MFDFIKITAFKKVMSTQRFQPLMLLRLPLPLARTLAQNNGQKLWKRRRGAKSIHALKPKHLVVEAEPGRWGREPEELSVTEESEEPAVTEESKAVRRGDNLRRRRTQLQKRLQKSSRKKPPLRQLQNLLKPKHQPRRLPKLKRQPPEQEMPRSLLLPSLWFPSYYLAY